MRETGRPRNELMFRDLILESDNCIGSLTALLALTQTKDSMLGEALADLVRPSPSMTMWLFLLIVQVSSHTVRLSVHACASFVHESLLRPLVSSTEVSRKVCSSPDATQSDPCCNVEYAPPRWYIKYL